MGKETYDLVIAGAGIRRAACTRFAEPELRAARLLVDPIPGVKPEIAVRPVSGFAEGIQEYAHA